MTLAARSIFVFGLYLVLLGAALMIVPNVVLAPFGFPATNEVWIRLAGSLVVIIGWFFLVAARHENGPFFRATLLARPFLFLSLVAFVLFGLAPPQLILFGVIDLLGALWTFLALRRG
ncbi:MAG: hypothetical protein ABIO40_02030 [Devosia sp.]